MVPEIEEAFASADAETARISALRDDAVSAVEFQEDRLAALASVSVLSLDAAKVEKEALTREAGYFEALPAYAAAMTSGLEAVKPFYLAPQGAPADSPKRGLVAQLFRRRPSATCEQEATLISPDTAQAAYAGRSARLSHAFGFVDEALSAIVRRRGVLDAAVFSLQERAVGYAKQSQESDARQVFAAEELASLLAAHSDALAVHSRLLSAVDRSSHGVEDDVADAAEAHMDSVLAESL